MTVCISKCLNVLDFFGRLVGYKSGWLEQRGASAVFSRSSGRINSCKDVVFLALPPATLSAVQRGFRYTQQAGQLFVAVHHRVATARNPEEQPRIWPFVYKARLLNPLPHGSVSPWVGNWDGTHILALVSCVAFAVEELAGYSCYLRGVCFHFVSKYFSNRIAMPSIESWAPVGCKRRKLHGTMWFSHCAHIPIFAWIIFLEGLRIYQQVWWYVTKRPLF